MSEKKESKSISGIIDEVKAEICDKICKWPEKYGADKEDLKEDLLEKKCMEECPLGRL